MPEIAIYAGIAFLSATVGFFAGALLATSKIAFLENRVSVTEHEVERLAARAEALIVALGQIATLPEDRASHAPSNPSAAGIAKTTLHALR